MPFVRVLTVGENGDHEEGRITWDGKALAADPPGSTLLAGILGEAIVAPGPGGTRRLTAADGPAFLEGLRYQYRGAYLRCTAPEGD